jgi:hypothetical protein
LLGHIDITQNQYYFTQLTIFTKTFKVKQRKHNSSEYKRKWERKRVHERFTRSLEKMVDNEQSYRRWILVTLKDKEKVQ